MEEIDIAEFTQHWIASLTILIESIFDIKVKKLSNLTSIDGNTHGQLETEEGEKYKFISTDDSFEITEKL